MHPREKRKELDQDNPEFLNEDDFPEEPNTWLVDDFEDILGFPESDLFE